MSSDKYNPQQRKFCGFCNCWYADNKISVDSHERGAKHQANVEKDLYLKRKTKQDLAAAEAIFMQHMQKIERAAMKSFEEDAKRDQFAKDELERVRVAMAMSSKQPK